MSASDGEITSIVQDPKAKARYHIYVDGTFAFDIHEDILVKYSLHKGKTLEPSLYHDILIAEEQNRAYQYALRYLGIRPRTAAQVEAYLKEKGFGSELGREIRKRCESQGYIDDRAFATQWMRERMVTKSRSLFALCMELRQKGIAEEIIQEAAERIQQRDQVEAACRLIAKKLRFQGEHLDYETRQKTIAMLLRKGFSHTIARQAMQEWVEGQVME